MELNPAQFRLLLAGPKVSRLLPFVTARGYVADAAVTGADALDLMRQSPRHVLLVELELDDILLPDLLQTVRAENLAGAVILIEDPARSGQIVSALVRGCDGYVATPPDELYLFRVIERQLLAQWALAQARQGSVDQDEKKRLEKLIQHERSKVTELVKEIASLREEVRAAKAARKAPPKIASEEGSGEFDDIDDAVTEQAARSVAAHLRSSSAASTTGPGATVADDETNPQGWDPKELREQLQKTKPKQKPAAPLSEAKTKPAQKPARDVGFDDQPRTIGSEEELAAREALADSEDEGLFLDLDDPTTGETLPKHDDDGFLLDDD